MKPLFFFKFNKIGIMFRHYNHPIIEIVYALKTKRNAV